MPFMQLLLSQLHVLYCVLCEQRVKQLYKDVEEEPPVYFYMEYGADVIGVNSEGSTWPLEYSKLALQV